MELKNYMENLVWQYLPDVLAGHSNVCGCERCRYDVVALALNFLPPRYVVTEKGQVITKVKSLEQQFNVDLIAALTNAIIIVKSRPHHTRPPE